ncbi:MAG TPA: hypothetical protein VE267_11150 [Bradyrhizobium sp.]|nr:hypothetical protein [Bradyrhizobium sp.]
MPKPNVLLTLIAGAPVIALSWAALGASETDWWRTNGAAVVQHQSGDSGTACSLFLYNKDDAAVVTWDRTAVREISFYDSGWRFAADQPVPVAVRLGDSWLGAPGEQAPPHLMASADQGRLSVPVTEPVENLLRNAARITVRVTDQETSIDVDRPKMPALLAAVERCRATLK